MTGYRYVPNDPDKPLPRISSGTRIRWRSSLGSLIDCIYLHDASYCILLSNYDHFWPATRENITTFPGREAIVGLRSRLSDEERASFPNGWWIDAPSLELFRGAFLGVYVKIRILPNGVEEGT